jgi:hypothetical protein
MENNSMVSKIAKTAVYYGIGTSTLRKICFKLQHLSGQAKEDQCAFEDQLLPISLQRMQVPPK